MDYTLGELLLAYVAAVVVTVIVIVAARFTRRSSLSPTEYGLRLVTLALASLGCAFCAMVVAFLATWLFLPDSDGAQGDPVGSLLVFLVVGSFFALPLSLVGFVFAAFLLREASLRRALPWIVGTTCIATAAGSLLNLRLGAFAGGVVGIATMYAVRGSALAADSGDRPGDS